jgi:hypothetical protein
MYYKDTEYWTSYGSVESCTKEEAHYVDIGSYEELENENSELKAQVELLQHRVKDLSAANKLSIQCLAELRAEAVERATNLYVHKFGNDESLNEVGIDIIRKYKEYIHPNGLRDYVEQLRSGTDGEYSQTTKESK